MNASTVFMLSTALSVTIIGAVVAVLGSGKL